VTSPPAFAIAATRATFVAPPSVQLDGEGLWDVIASVARAINCAGEQRDARRAAFMRMMSSPTLPIALPDWRAYIDARARGGPGQC
jgi:hypothetical protein